MIEQYSPLVETWLADGPTYDVPRQNIPSVLSEIADGRPEISEPRQLPFSSPLSQKYPYPHAYLIHIGSGCVVVQFDHEITVKEKIQYCI